MTLKSLPSWGFLIFRPCRVFNFELLKRLRNLRKGRKIMYYICQKLSRAADPKMKKDKLVKDTLVIRESQKKEIHSPKTWANNSVKSASELIRKAIDNLLNQK